MNSLKIALVHDMLLKLGGAERVLKVLHDLFPTAPIYTLLYDEQRVGHVFPKSLIRTSSLQNWPAGIRHHYRYLFPLLPRMIESFDFSGFDLVISSSTAYAHGILTPLATRHISYCHSPMRYAWDWTHHYIKEQRIGPLKIWMIRKFLHQVRLWDYYASDRADLYLANSKNVRHRIQKYFRKDAVVLYPPVEVNRFTLSRTSHSRADNFFLIVSTLTPYKNIELAVHLFNKIRKKLVIIGEGPDRERLQKLAGPTIDFLGFKPDEVVREYMQECRALVFPGEEDFGITPVEAMACGKPVLAFGKGGVMESVVAGSTGEFFEEPTVESMENALARLLANERFYDAKRIRMRAEKFSRAVFEEGIKKVIENLMSRP